MAYLFVDSTNNLTVGILNKDFSWMQYETIESNKTSQVLHSKINELLNSEKVDVQKLLGIITMAGPGSYTGMRLSEGLSQIFDWQGINSFSFYHFDIPSFFNLKKFIFISNAFKNEYFIKTVNCGTEEIGLFKKDEVKKRLQNALEENFPIYSNNNLSEEFEVSNWIKTFEQIQKESSSIFKYVIENKMKKDIYYYRPVEVEFKSN